MSSAEIDFQPGGVWSLWDILNHDAAAFCRFSNIIGQTIISLRFGTLFDPQIVAPHIIVMQDEAKQIGIVLVNDQLERIKQYFHGGSIRQNQLINMFDELYNRLNDELKSRVFVHISNENVRYYEQIAPIFGSDVYNKFPSAIYDIEEAAKCYALDRSTASAFHSVRLLEAAIRALSRCLSIPDPVCACDRNWDKVLGSIKTEIDNRWPGTSVRMFGEGQFFDTAYGALASMQNPYRNPAMHLDRKYTLDEAIYIMDTVKGFMKKIASRMDENGDPLASLEQSS